MIHVLGFTLSKYDQFLDIPGNVLDPYGVHNKTRAVSSVVQNVTKNGHTVDMIVTPTVVEAVRMHSGCNTLAGAYLEDGGGTGSAGSHWEKRTLGNELMTSSASQHQDAILSNITLALFHDMGYYVVNFDKAETLAWGNNLGCNFTEGNCATTDWPTEGYRCTSNVQSCTFDRQHKGVCSTKTYSTDLPTYYQHFAGQPRFGGLDVLADYCPFVRAFTNRDCIYDSGTQFGTVFSQPEETGNSSRCFMSTLEHLETLGTQEPLLTNGPMQPTCLEFRCISNTGLHVRVKNIWIDCTPGSDAQTGNKTVFGFAGSFQCPQQGSWMCRDFEKLKANSNVTAWPTIGGVSPVTTPMTGGTSITVTGNNLKPENGLELSIDMHGVPVTTISSVSKSQIVFQSPVIGGLEQDTLVDIVITMDRGSGLGGYMGSYRMYANVSRSVTVTTTIPSITSVKPNGIPNSGGTRITIVGQHLGLSGHLDIKINDMHCTDVEIDLGSFSRTTCITPALPSATSDQSMDIKIVFTAQNNFITSSNALLVGPNWPSVSRVFPTGVSPTTGMWLVIYGTGIPSATFTALAGNMACQQVDVISSEIIVCQTQGSTLTSKTVVDLNVDGGSQKWMQGRSMVTIDPGYAHISSVSPSRGPDYGLRLLTISGTNLLQLNSTTLHNETTNGPYNSQWPIIRLNTPTTEGVGCDLVSISDTQIVCRTQSFVAHVASGESIATGLNITGTGYGAYVHKGYTFDGGWLSVSAVEPNGASTLGTSYLEISGTRFPTSGTVPVVQVGGVNCVGVVVVSSTLLTCKAGQLTGSSGVTPSDIVVTDAQGRSGSLSNSFVYDTSWPRFSVIKPSSGNATGGTKVTLTGDGFVLGTPVNVTIGNVVCNNANSTSPTQIVCTTGKQEELEPGKSKGYRITVFHGNQKVLSPPDVFLYKRDPIVGPPPPWPWYYWVVFALILLIPYMILGGIRAARKPVDLSGLIVYRVHMKLRKHKKRGTGGEVMSFEFDTDRIRTNSE
eukprot:TRINITY_DN612_c2_g1_i1.p1 TRINITY_DN612_c2_g1~~TRINITY_DN612_c2_g1_i1.p1  ORF type:complete len:1009 (+),score=224.98 TRINITY_DN612_c2_g1_i1:1041-4067(+)